MSNEPINSWEVLATLARENAEISSVQLKRIGFPPLAEGRVDHLSRSTAVIEKAMKVRAELGLPYWDSMMLVCCRERIADKGIFSAALFHNRDVRERITLETPFTPFDVQKSTAKIADNEFMVISSRVSMRDGHTMHIPMIDFHCPSSPASMPLITSVVETIGIPGYVLDSGKSYHFIGSSLISEGALGPFLGRVLAFGSIVDRAWVSHQLVEGEAALRISRKPGYGDVPIVVTRTG